MKYQIITNLEHSINTITNIFKGTVNSNWKLVTQLKHQLHQLKLEAVCDRLTEFEYQFTGINQLTGTNVDRILTVMKANPVITKLCREWKISVDDYHKVAEILLNRIAKTSY